MATPMLTRKWLSFAGLLIINLMVALDLTILSNALPVIARDLHSDTTSIYWASTSFVLCSAIVQPIFTSLCILGRKTSILIALALFAIGSIVCAVALNTATLIGGRSIQGVGGGGLLALTYIVMVDLFHLEQQTRVYGAVSLMWLVGSIAGPVTGGAFAYYVSWRWIFWLNLPFVLMSYVFIIAFFKSPNVASELSFFNRLKGIDWIGMSVFATSITLLLISISWGGITYAWNSLATTVPLIAGSLLFLMWSMYSYGICDKPMIPLIVIADRTAAISYFGTVLQGIIFFGLMYSLPLYYQTAKGYSPVISGLALLPQCILSGLSTASTSFFIGKTHVVKLFSLTGWLLLAYGTSTLDVLSTDTSILNWITLNEPSGIGIGILFASLSIATQASAENRSNLSYDKKAEVKAVAAALNPFFRAIGEAFGIVICQAAFSNELSRRLGKHVASDAASLVEVIRNMPLDEPDRSMLINAFVESLRVVWYVLFAMSCLMIALTLLTQDYGVKTAKEELAPNEQTPRFGEETTAKGAWVDTEHGQSARGPLTVRNI